MSRERVHDRRTGTRFEIVGRLAGTLEASGLLQVKNIGGGGVLVEAPWPLPVNSQHGVRLELPLPAGAVDVQVQVRHVTAAPHGVSAARYSIGVEFLALDDGVRKRSSG